MAATWAATRLATEADTEAATEAATWAATRDATRDATWVATRAATRVATWAASRAATGAEDLSKWYVVNGDLRALAHQIEVGDFGLRCAAETWRMWSGGNQWSGYDAYLSFFQDIAGLEIDYSAYRHWRALAEHSGPRIVHPDFCMISDRPEVLLVDDQNRPHCEDGPFCRWRDGSALYNLHELQVPAHVIERPSELTFEQVRDEPNAEIRRHMLDRFGGKRGSEAQAAWLLAGGLKPISTEDITAKMQPGGLSIWRLSHGPAPVTCRLYQAPIPNDEPLSILMVVCTSTAKEVPLRVPPTIRDAAEARAWTFGRDLAPAFET
jgi:hypothetical protein